MKTSELIRQLKELKEIYGDLPVKKWGREDMGEVLGAINTSDEITDQEFIEIF